MDYGCKGRCVEVEWQGMEEKGRVAVAMDRACTDPAVGRAMERLWRRRFTADGPHLSTISFGR